MTNCRQVKNLFDKTFNERYSAMKKFFLVKNFELYFDKIILNINRKWPKINQKFHKNLFNKK